MVNNVKNDKDEISADAIAAMRAFLIANGMDLRDPNLKDTPRRVAKMFKCELLSGYHSDAAPEIVSFPTAGVKQKLVITEKLPIDSMCAHHLMPISGYAQIGLFFKANAKNKGIAFPGLSKYGRVVEYFARRLQVQELLGQQIADYLLKNTEAKQVMVRIKATHFCMVHRGILARDAATTTMSIAQRTEDSVFMNTQGMFGPDHILMQFYREIESAK